MSDEQGVFHFDDGKPSFEDLGNENGVRYWYASDLMRMLGYGALASFRKAVNKAIGACTALGIPVQENFIQERRIVDGFEQDDFRLTRFACYLTAINGDSKKPQVAAAQAYFVTYAEAFRQYIQNAENVERVLIRDEVSDREKSLTGLAAQRDIRPGLGYALFQDAGYRGLYNMALRKLKMRKGVDGKRALLDFMGKTELAANLFRITQTEEVIRARGIRGQTPLEMTAHQVGRKVRESMLEISGIPPEDLPISADIKQVKAGLKGAQREFAKLDGAKKPRKSLPPPDGSE